MRLSVYSSKSYAVVVLCDSEAIFFGDEEDAAFCPFLCYVMIIHSTE